jgi:hypothetical protein
MQLKNSLREIMTYSAKKKKKRADSLKKSEDEILVDFKYLNQNVHTLKKTKKKTKNPFRYMKGHFFDPLFGWSTSTQFNSIKTWPLLSEDRRTKLKFRKNCKVSL